MRILLLTQVVPFPPDSGPKVKTYHVLRYLARQHDVHLVSFVRTSAENQAADQLREFCASVDLVPIQRSRVRDVRYLIRSLRSGLPFLVERDDSAAMRETIRGLLAQHRFDAVHADQLTMGQFAVDLPVPLRVLDEHNAVWTIVRRTAQRQFGPIRWLAEREARVLRAYEGALCRAFDRVLVVSDEDRYWLEAAAQASLSAMVIPIAVDTETLAFAERGPEARHVVSVATMFYPPNAEGVAWFARDVFPRIRRASPQTRFFIVGARPPASIERLAGEESGIEVTGYVPDLAEILRKSAVLVVPLHSASGMRVKILEAFSRGLPVVATRIGAEGIDVQDGEHLLIADNPEAFAQAVLRMLNDPEESARLARNSRALIESRYDWLSALGLLDTLYAPSAPPASDGNVG